MTKIYTKLFNYLEIGDDFPTIIMGVLNLSPESFYQGSVYEDAKSLEKAVNEMVKGGAKMLDLGARSTAPWSKKITVEEEIKRINKAMQLLCEIIPDDVIISIDTQYSAVAEEANSIAKKLNKKIIINDVSCLKTDPKLADYAIKEDIPLILMASQKLPGDLLEVDQIIAEFQLTIESLTEKGYNEDLLIIDPGIGKWIHEKTPEYDMKIISNLERLRVLKKPILVALSRKSFIGSVLNIEDPEKRYNGTLSATAISVYNGAHIIRTHDVNQQVVELIKMAEEMRNYQ